MAQEEIHVKYDVFSNSISLDGALESLLGFEELCRAAYRINGATDVELKIVAIRSGSVDFNLVLEIVDSLKWPVIGLALKAGTKWALDTIKSSQEIYKNHQEILLNRIEINEKKAESTRALEDKPRLENGDLVAGTNRVNDFGLLARGLRRFLQGALKDPNVEGVTVSSREDNTLSLTRREMEGFQSFVDTLIEETDRTEFVNQILGINTVPFTNIRNQWELKWHRYRQKHISLRVHITDEDFLEKFLTGRVRLAPGDKLMATVIIYTQDLGTQKLEIKVAEIKDVTVIASFNGGTLPSLFPDTPPD